MATVFSKEIEDDLRARGYSRRQFGRISSLLSVGAAFGSLMPEAFAAAPRKDPGFVGHTDMIRISTNECWTGPFPSPAAAGQAIVLQGNRYEPDHLRKTLIETAATVEGAPVENVLPWPGSSEPLLRTVICFCSPTRGVVTANPTYEAVWGSAEWLRTKLTRVPLSAANNYATDVRAMLRADPNAGMYYICSPNNPTGTVTSLEDIQWLADNKPKDAVLVVDEAYIHFSPARSAIPLTQGRDDVLVLRTFSKLFGMAGLRLGLTFASPALHDRMMRFDGENLISMLSVVAMAVGGPSLVEKDMILQRRNDMIAARDMTLAHLTRRNIRFIPGSQANMILVDWKKPAPAVKEAFARQKIEIGRNWPIWPTMSRVTIGSMRDMEGFCAALDRIMA